MVDIYICHMQKVEQPYPRHHLSSIAVCSEKKEALLSDIAEKLEKEHVEALMNGNDVVIIGEDAIKHFIGEAEMDDTSIYIRITPKS